MTFSLRPWTLTLLLSLLSTSFIAQTHTHDGITPCGLNLAEEMLFLRRPETRNAAIEATRALELETQQGAGHGSLPATSWCVYARLYNNAEKAELGLA